MATSKDTVTSLAAQIASGTEAIKKYLDGKGLTEPSFAADAPTLPDAPEVQAARFAIAEAASKLHHLILGPADYLISQTLTLKHDQFVLDILDQFNIFDAVPLTGDVSYADIAEKVGLSEQLVRRVLRYAMTLQIFAETAPGSGRIVHTATSAEAAKSPLLRAWIGHQVEEVASCAVKGVEAIRRFPDSTDPTQAAIMMALAPDKVGTMSFFNWAAQEGEGEKRGWRVRRFAQAMACMSTRGFGSHINDGFDWDSLGEATVVDIGGSTGHASINIAKEHPRLKCIVQDFDYLEPKFNELLPEDLKQRVTFQAHDFFTPQPVKHADVYFFKHILHDWADPLSVRILRALLPALKPGSRVILMDGVLPPRGSVPLQFERMVTALDLQMLIALNARERSVEDWKALFKEADERFQFRGMRQPPGSAAALIEFAFDAA